MDQRCRRAYSRTGRGTPKSCFASPRGEFPIGSFCPRAADSGGATTGRELEMNYQNNASLHAQLGSAGASGCSPLLAQGGLIVPPQKRLLPAVFCTVEKDIPIRGNHHSL